MVPRTLVPVVMSLVRDQDHETEERPIYASDEEPEGQGPSHNIPRCFLFK